MAVNNNNPIVQSSVRTQGAVGDRPVASQQVTTQQAAQREAYMQGRNDERSVQQNFRSQERAFSRAQANDNMASGTIVGLLMALLAVGVGAVAYFLAGDRPAPIAIPQIERETTTERETTVIEKDDSQVPVSLPDVNVQVPDITLPEIKLPATNNSDPAEPAAEEPAAEEPVAEPKPESASAESEPTN